MRKLILAVALAAALAAQAITPTLLRQADRKAVDHWVDSVYNSLTPRQRVAQLLCPKMVPTQGKLSMNTIKNWVGEQGIGGLIYTEGNIDQFAEVTDYAQKIAKVPVLITLDGEWGLAMRVRNTQRYPNNMACGAVSNPQLVYDYGREVGRQCRLMGINVNFAPVADVNSNAKNPVIGYRSFGENPEAVATLVSAYSRGLESAGVQAVAKHWPGHGDTDSDSHKALPVVNKNRKQLEAIELVPFRRFINDGCSGVMTAHLSMPKMDKTGTPASMSAPLYKLLRDDLGFEGLAYTDALTMKGATLAAKGNVCVAALQGGADVLLSGSTVDEDINAIMGAIEDGTLKASDVENRVRRVLTYKYLLGLNKRPVPVLNDGLADALNSPEAEAVNRALTAATMTVLANKSDILPLRNLKDRKIAIVSLGADDDNVFANTAGTYARATRFAQTPGHALTDIEISKIAGHNTVIVGVFNDKDDTQATYSALVNAVPEGTDLVAVFMTNPYKMAKFGADNVKAADALVMAYDDTHLCREYAAQTVYGGIAVDGKLPVTLKDIANAGTGHKLSKIRLGYSAPSLEGLKPELTAKIDSLVNFALDKEAMPGCQVLVARHGNIVHNKSYGKLTAGGEPVTDNTLYDLASVSKTIGTLPGVMVAVDRGLIDIDRKASDYIPGLRGSNKEDVTVKQLLYHESGIQPSLNMMQVVIDPATLDRDMTDRSLRTDLTSTARKPGFTTAIGRNLYAADCAYDTIMSRIYQSPLRENKNYAYSCLNFCLLMDAEQNVTKTPHTQFCTENIWAPLGMTTMTYRPLDNGFTTADVAPTEVDNYYRHQLVHGYVHDELADFSGGIQGNAGLFANANDIAKMCQMWLNNGVYGGDTIMSAETARMFTTSKSPTCRRGLGFDKPDTQNLDWSPCCDEADASVYGHTGFTGTRFWVDPKNDFIYVILCNRVNPTRDNPMFSKYGPTTKIMSEIYRAIEQ